MPLASSALVSSATHNSNPVSPTVPSSRKGGRKAGPGPPPQLTTIIRRRYPTQFPSSIDTHRTDGQIMWLFLESCNGRKCRLDATFDFAHRSFPRRGSHATLPRLSVKPKSAEALEAERAPASERGAYLFADSPSSPPSGFASSLTWARPGKLPVVPTYV